MRKWRGLEDTFLSQRYVPVHDQNGGNIGVLLSFALLLSKNLSSFTAWLKIYPSCPCFFTSSSFGYVLPILKALMLGRRWGWKSPCAFSHPKASLKYCNEMYIKFGSVDAEVCI